MVIFGAGRRGKRCLKTLREAGIEVDFFCDNNEKNWGNTVEGIPVISPWELQKNNIHSEIVIANKNSAAEIQAQLQLMGAEHIRTLEEVIFFHTRLSYTEDNLITDKKSEPAKTPELSIIVLGEAEISHATRRSIEAQALKIPYEILKWNGSLTEIKGKKLLFLENGAILQKGAIAELLEVQQQKGGIAGSKSVCRNGNINQAGYVITGSDTIVSYGYGENAAKSEYEYVREADAVALSGMMTDAKYFPEISEILREHEILAEASVRISLWMKTINEKVYFTPFSVVLEADVGNGVHRVQSKALWDACQAYVSKWSDTAENLFWKANRGTWYCRTLVADDTIAQFDKNAGNRSTYHYIQMFQEMNMWMVYLPDDFYYEYRYVNVFQKMGILVLYGEEWKNRWEQYLAPILNKVEYAFLNRPNIAAKYVDYIRENSDAWIVHYGHDLHHLRLKREYEITKEQYFLEESQRLKKIEYDLIPKVDITGYPSMVEVELLKREFPTAEIENFPLYFYEKYSSGLKEEGREGILFVGGFSHRPNEDAAIWLVQEILPDLRRQGIRDKVYLVGSNPTEKIRNLQSEDVIVTGYVTDEELETYYHRCFVDILPLRYGAGMKGKLLEAMYEGILVVTTDIGAEGLKSIENVVSIGNTAEEIVKRVVSLYAEKGTLKERMEAEREYMMAHFSKEAMKAIIEKHLTLKNQHRK